METGQHAALGGCDYAELVGALVAVRRFACEMSDVFAEMGGPESPEDAGARAMIDACDGALEALRYNEGRGT